MASGIGAVYAEDAILELGLKDKVTLLKLGFTHPLPEKIIEDFLSTMEKVLVVEELEPYLEEGLKAIAQGKGLTLPIHGKGEGLFSRLYEFHPALVRRVVARYFGAPFAAKAHLTAAMLMEQPLPERPPNLCPGCPHRAMYYAVKIALEDLGVEGILRGGIRLCAPRGARAWLARILASEHATRKAARFWMVSGRAIRRLPGNPVSAFTGFEVFVRPAILKMLGVRGLQRKTIRVKTLESIESDGRESFVRAIVEQEAGEWNARVIPNQGSGNLRSLVQANALLFVPSGVKSLPIGALVDAWLLDEI